MLRARLSVAGKKEHPTYHLTLSLQLPDHHIVVQKDSSDTRQLVSSSEAALKKELRRSTAKIRKEHLSRKRTSEKKAFSNFAKEVASTEEALLEEAMKMQPDTSPLFARLRPLLGPLYNHARELIRTAELAGEVSADYVTPDDLVDQAIVQIAERNGQVLTDPEVLETKLFRYIDAILTDEITRQKPENSSVMSIEQPAPEEIERKRMGQPEEEEVEYYQPFAALRMEDVLIDEHAIDPEHQLSDVEEHRVILKYLANFHAKARSAFFLNRVEGFDIYEIAMIQNRSEDQVKKDIDECAVALREGWQKMERGSESEQRPPAAKV
ncbi:hypothetical protein KQI84_18830 [bacterium]|nr:hypothetical protein [bacterium]